MQPGSEAHVLNLGYFLFLLPSPHWPDRVLAPQLTFHKSLLAAAWDGGPPLIQRAGLAPVRDTLVDGMFFWLAGGSEIGTVTLAKDCSPEQACQLPDVYWWGQQGPLKHGWKF